MRRPTSDRPTRTGVRDATWARFVTARGYGPLEVPPAEAVRQRWRGLRAAAPWHPAVRWLDADARRSHPVTDGELDGFLASVVVEVPGPGDAVELVARLQGEPMGRLPVRVFLGEHAAVVQTRHVVGDNRTVAEVVARLLGEGPVPEPSPRWPLLRAASTHLRAHPGSLPAAARALWPLSAPSSGPSAVHSRGPAPRVLHAVSGPQAVDAVRAWRREHAPTVSAGSVLFACIWRALRAEGVEPVERGLAVMVDCRRYLPEGTRVVGNFATGPYLEPADPTDPASVDAAIRGATTSGAPLLLLAGLTARNVLRRPGAVPPGRVRERPAPHLTLTHVGRASTAGLPFTGPAAGHRIVPATTPSSPEGVTVVCAELDGCYQLTTTVHADVLDADAVARALGAVCADPLGLLAT